MMLLTARSMERNDGCVSSERESTVLGNNVRRLNENLRDDIPSCVKMRGLGHINKPICGRRARGMANAVSETQR